MKTLTLILLAILTIASAATTQNDVRFGNLTLYTVSRNATFDILIVNGEPHLFVMQLGDHRRSCWGGLSRPGIGSPRVALMPHTVLFIDDRPCAIGAEAGVTLYDRMMSSVVIRSPITVDTEHHREISYEGSWAGLYADLGFGYCLHNSQCFGTRVCENYLGANVSAALLRIRWW